MYKRNADIEYIHFLNDPEGRGLLFFKCIKERAKYVRSLIHQYYDPDSGWSEYQVNRIVTGKVTHLITKTNIGERPKLTKITSMKAVTIGDFKKKRDYKMVSNDTLANEEHF